MPLALRSKLFIAGSFVVGLAAGGAVTWQNLSAPATSERSDNTPRTELALPAWSPQRGASQTTLTKPQTRPAVDGWLRMEGDFNTRLDTLRTLLVSLPSPGFARLLAGLENRKDDDNQKLLNIVLEVWNDLFPADAARWAALNLSQNRANSALRAWADADPLAASEWACRLADPEQAVKLGRTVLPKLAAENPAQAIALLDSLDPDVRRQLLPSILAQLGENDPSGTLRRFGPELWDNGKGYSGLQGLLANWAKTDPHSTVAWLLAQPRENDRDMRGWLRSLVQNNPDNWEQIATVVATAADIPDRQRTLSEMVSRWKNDQPDRILSFLDGLGDTHLKNRVLAQLSNGYNSNRPDQTLPYALAMATGAERTQRLKWLLSSWGKSDPTATFDWIAAHQDPAVAAASTSVQAAVLANIANDEPDTALAVWAEINDPDTRLAAIQPIANAWGKTDPAAALKWLYEQKEVFSNSNTYQDPTRLIYSWRQRDPEAALSWTEQQILSQRAKPQTGYQPDLLGALAGDWNNKADRAETTELFTKIQNPELRTIALTDHVKEWLKFDRKAATEWLDTHKELTPEQAAALLAEANQ